MSSWMAICASGAVRQIKTRIRLLAQPKSMRSQLPDGALIFWLVVHGPRQGSPGTLGQVLCSGMGGGLSFGMLQSSPARFKQFCLTKTQR